MGAHGHPDGRPLLSQMPAVAGILLHTNFFQTLTRPGRLIAASSWSSLRNVNRDRRMGCPVPACGKPNLGAAYIVSPCRAGAAARESFHVTTRDGIDDHAAREEIEVGLPGMVATDNIIIIRRR